MKYNKLISVNPPISGQYQFHVPTADTRVMIGAALEVMSKIYIDKVRYSKAGVMLLGICQHDEVQLDMFDTQSESEGNKRSELMALVDELNSRFQHDRNQNCIYIKRGHKKDADLADEP